MAITIKEKIAVMQAFADGKKIEVSPHGGTWKLCGYPNWNWSQFEYRVERQEFWVNLYQDDTLFIYKTLEEANKKAGKGRSKVLHLIEVL